MNIFDLIKNLINKGMTPKGIVKNFDNYIQNVNSPKAMVKNITKNSPMLNNLIQMADKGDNKGVETFARNVLKERGLDFDTEMDKMKKTLGIN